MKTTLAAGLLLCSLVHAQPTKTVDADTPRDVQIRIAKSAAPSDVSDHADIYVLGKQGYELAIKGTNGFSCMISRQYLNTVEPECFDAEGTRTTVKTRMFQEAERAKGTAEEQIAKAIEAGYKSGKFKAPAKAGIVYMLSDNNYVFDPSSKQVIHFPGHLMFYAPYATAETIGSGKGAPFISNPGRPDALLIVVPKT